MVTLDDSDPEAVTDTSDESEVDFGVGEGETAEDLLREMMGKAGIKEQV